MKNAKKIIAVFSMVMALLFVGIMKVEAAELNVTDITTALGSGNEVAITPEDTLSIGTDKWFGPDARITISTGKVTLKNSDTTGYIDMVLDGTMTINEGKQFISQFTIGSNTTPVRLVINEGSTMNINGNFAIPSGSKGIVLNKGTVNVAGNMELRSDGMYTSTGTTNITGNFAIYGTNDGANLGDSILSLSSAGNIYSDSDIKANIVSSEEDTDGYTWEVADNDKTYESITDSIVTAAGENVFANGYKLEKKEVTTEETTDEEGNPDTADNVMLYVGVGTLSLVGLAAAGIYTKRTKFN